MILERLLVLAEEPVDDPYKIEAQCTLVNGLKPLFNYFIENLVGVGLFAGGLLVAGYIVGLVFLGGSKAGKAIVVRLLWTFLAVVLLGVYIENPGSFIPRAC